MLGGALVDGMSDAEGETENVGAPSPPTVRPIMSSPVNKSEEGIWLVVGITDSVGLLVGEVDGIWLVDGSTDSVGLLVGEPEGIWLVEGSTETVGLLLGEPEGIWLVEG